MRQRSQDIWTRSAESLSPNFDDGIMIQMTSTIYDIDNIWTIHKKYLRVLPSILSCNSNVTSVSFPSAYFPSSLTLHPGKVLPHMEGQIATENRNFDSRSAMLSEKDLDQTKKTQKE